MITPRQLKITLRCAANDTQVGTLSQTLPKDRRPLASCFLLGMHWAKAQCLVEGRSPRSCISLAAQRSVILSRLGVIMLFRLKNKLLGICSVSLHGY